MTTHKQVHSTEEALELALKALERMKSYGNVFAYHRYEKTHTNKCAKQFHLLKKPPTAKKPWQTIFLTPRKWWHSRVGNTLHYRDGSEVAA